MRPHSYFSQGLTLTDDALVYTFEHAPTTDLLRLRTVSARFRELVGYVLGQRINRALVTVAEDPGAPYGQFALAWQTLKSQPPGLGETENTKYDLLRQASVRLLWAESWIQWKSQHPTGLVSRLWQQGDCTLFNYLVQRPEDDPNWPMHMENPPRYLAVAVAGVDKDIKNKTVLKRGIYDVEHAEFLLKNGMPANANRRIALEFGVITHSVEFVRTLLQHGASATPMLASPVWCEMGEGPGDPSRILWAPKLPLSDLTQPPLALLVKSIYRPVAPTGALDMKNSSALRLDILARMLMANAPQHLPDLTDPNGATPLHHLLNRPAFYKAHRYAMQQRQIFDENLFTPLRALVIAIADTGSYDMLARDSRQDTAFHVMSPDQTSARLVLELIAVPVYDERHYAVVSFSLRGNLRDRFDPNDKGYFGRTPLFAACTVTGNIGEKLRLRLLQLGAHPYVRDDAGVSPELWALRDRLGEEIPSYELAEQFKQLEKEGFGMDLTDQLGMSARSYLVQKLTQDIELEERHPDPMAPGASAESVRRLRKLREQIGGKEATEKKTIQRMGLLR